MILAPLVLFSCSKSSSTTLIGNWTQLTDYKGVGRSGSVCFTIADTAYIGLGYNPSNKVKYPTDFYKYDYKKNQWKEIAPFPLSSGRVNAVAFSVGNKGYVGTGYDGNDYLSDFYEYNSVTNSWRRIKDLDIVGRRGAVAFSIGNNGFVGTGYNGNYLSDFWKYTPGADSASGSWTSVADISFKRANAASFVINNLGYVVTGDDNGTYLSSFYRYDPASDTWTKLRNITNTDQTQTYDDNYNIIRSNAVGFAANNLGYITCGILSGSYETNTWEYDPTTDVWTQKTSFEGTSRSEAVGFSLGNRIFVGLGKNGGSSWSDFWEFKPTETYDAYN